MTEKPGCPDPSEIPALAPPAAAKEADVSSNSQLPQQCQSNLDTLIQSPQSVWPDIGHSRHPPTTPVAEMERKCPLNIGLPHVPGVYTRNTRAPRPILDLSAFASTGGSSCAERNSRVTSKDMARKGAN